MTNDTTITITILIPPPTHHTFFSPLILIYS